MATETVCGIARVKDEADIIRPVVEHMLTQVDWLLIADNASTDGTREILAELQTEHDAAVCVVHDDELGYFQSRQMSALAARAAELGAEWVVPFDADEVWYSPFGRIAHVLADQDSASIAGALLYDHVATGTDPDDPNPLTRIGHRRVEPAKLPKVAARARPPVTIHQGNHGADHGERVDGLLIVRHFPLRSPEQMVRKSRNGGAAYAATDLPDHIGAHWRQWSQLSDEQLGDVFREFYWEANPTRGLIFDPAPVVSPTITITMDGEWRRDSGGIVPQ